MKNRRELCPFFADAKPRIIGHRGAAGVAPENTLPSFERAFDDGAQFVELDVRESRDGEVVIIHDETLERTTNGVGLVNQHTLKELKALDAGYRFKPDGVISYPFRNQKIELPTLEDFFSSFPLGRAIIEIKQGAPSIVKTVIESIRRFSREEQVLLATEKDEIMTEIRREIEESCPYVATGFSHGEVAAFIMGVVRGGPAPLQLKGQAFQIPCEYEGLTLVSEKTIAACHNLGLEMFVWTINDPGEMRRLLSMGVDGIITDFPSRLRDATSEITQKKLS